MTLSARYICDDPIGVRLLSVIPFADIVFGYEDVSFSILIIFTAEHFPFLHRKQKFWHEPSIMLRYVST